MEKVDEGSSIMNTPKGQVMYAEDPSPEQRGIMTDPREQLASPPRTTSAGFHEQLQSMDAGSTGQPGPKSSRWRSQWLATTLVLTVIPLVIGGVGLLLFAEVHRALMIALLLVGGTSLLMVAGVYFALSSIRVETRHFSVSPYPQVVIFNDHGTIHINAGGTSTEVTIQTTIWSRRLVKASQATYICCEQSDDGNTITARVERMTPPKSNDTERVDFDVTVPINTDLRLITKTGDIWSTGISGQMLLVSDSGTITVQRGILSGNSLLTTGTGAINFSHQHTAHSCHCQR